MDGLEAGCVVASATMCKSYAARHASLDGKPFTFYATVSSDLVRPYMPDVPVLLPASSWARKMNRAGVMRPPKLPDHVTQRAADCGGYVATFTWGDYRFSPQQYVDWLETWRPQWAATMDYCCEDEITSGNVGIVRERQQRTTEMAYRFWQDHRDAPWRWCPTVQGWEPEDYRRHARDLAPLVAEMAARYTDRYGPASDFRVGIGTLCRRADAPTIARISEIVATELPGIPLHLWGVKITALKSRVALPRAVRSCDSAAWEGAFGEGHEQRRASGLTEREYAYKVALPRYLSKVNAALDMPKQQRLF